MESQLKQPVDMRRGLIALPIDAPISSGLFPPTLENITNRYKDLARLTTELQRQRKVLLQRNEELAQEVHNLTQQLKNYSPVRENQKLTKRQQLFERNLAAVTETHKINLTKLQARSKVIEERSKVIEERERRLREAQTRFNEERRAYIGAKFSSSQRETEPISRELSEYLNPGNDHFPTQKEIIPGLLHFPVFYHELIDGTINNGPAGRKAYYDRLRKYYLEGTNDDGEYWGTRAGGKNNFVTRINKWLNDLWDSRIFHPEFHDEYNNYEVEGLNTDVLIIDLENFSFKIGDNNINLINRDNLPLDRLVEIVINIVSRFQYICGVIIVYKDHNKFVNFFKSVFKLKNETTDRGLGAPVDERVNRLQYFLENTELRKFFIGIQVFGIEPHRHGGKLFHHSEAFPGPFHDDYVREQKYYFGIDDFIISCMVHIVNNSKQIKRSTQHLRKSVVLSWDYSYNENEFDLHKNINIDYILRVTEVNESGLISNHKSMYYIKGSTDFNDIVWHGWHRGPTISEVVDEDGIMIHQHNFANIPGTQQHSDFNDFKQAYYEKYLKYKKKYLKLKELEKKLDL